MQGELGFGFSCMQPTGKSLCLHAGCAVAVDAGGEAQESVKLKVVLQEQITSGSVSLTSVMPLQLTVVLQKAVAPEAVPL